MSFLGCQKLEIRVAFMGLNVLSVVTFALDTKQRKMLSPSMARMKTRNNVWECCLLDQDRLACVGKQK